MLPVALFGDAHLIGLLAHVASLRVVAPVLRHLYARPDDGGFGHDASHAHQLVQHARTQTSGRHRILFHGACAVQLEPWLILTRILDQHVVFLRSVGLHPLHQSVFTHRNG